MRSRRTYFTVAMIVLLAVMAACYPACVTIDKVGQQNLPIKAYHTALRIFNTALESYEAHYQAAPADQQATWRKEIDPVILKADAALDAWGLAVTVPGGNDIAARREAYGKIKAELWQCLMDAGIVE